MLFWDYSGRWISCGRSYNFDVMIPETDLEKSLLFCFLCESLRSIGLDGSKYRVDCQGIWTTAKKRMNGSNEVEGYFCELWRPDEDDDESDEYAAGFVVVRQLEKVVLPDGTIQRRAGPPHRITVFQTLMSLFRNVLKKVGVKLKAL